LLNKGRVGDRDMDLGSIKSAHAQRIHGTSIQASPNTKRIFNESTINREA
jgi:hypothetical protein